MFDKKVKFIDIRFISSKSIMIQLIKLISYLQYSLENSNEHNETVITIRIKNRYKSSLLASIGDKSITAMPHSKEIVIGE